MGMGGYGVCSLQLFENITSEKCNYNMVIQANELQGGISI